MTTRDAQLIELWEMIARGTGDERTTELPSLGAQVLEQWLDGSDFAAIAETLDQRVPDIVDVLRREYQLLMQYIIDLRHGAAQTANAVITKRASLNEALEYPNANSHAQGYNQGQFAAYNELAHEIMAWLDHALIQFRLSSRGAGLSALASSDDERDRFIDNILTQYEHERKRELSSN